ncbi:MAG: VOC family protein [Microbacterium sp.]|jgi:predicted enzyme related to lactoylglutathione lyase|uniref:VOC family protein n=1 Tax=Microbacterium sp. TaxID=51671 RepID=UPI0028339FB4|nr:VOC family protein [Microbacterium sp.]MDR2322191.1 VOC family protein [Microbacterium sp.]
MPLELESVMFRSTEPARAAAFWATMLDRAPQEDADGILLPATPTQVGVRFSRGGAHSPLKNRVHLHLSRADRTQRETIAAAEKAGGRRLGSGNIPVGGYAVMSDPTGDEFCVIEDQNTYLDGCGPLGEATCEGTRTSGLFWSEALGWPLVWDQDEETAIQSPAGGTKLAWSGDEVDPARDPSRQAFVLTSDPSELAEELERLTSLGATLIGTTPTGATILRDPDGVDFLIRS